MESVVDYDAWRKGYNPPSEHILIDALSYRDAKVVLASQSPELSFWFVIQQDAGMTRRKSKALLKMMKLVLDEIEEDEPPLHPLAAENNLQDAP